MTTVLPDPNEPIVKGKLLDKLKTPKTAEEIKQIEDAKKAQAAEEKEGEGKKKDKKKKKAEEVDENDLFNFTPIPLEEQKVDYKKDMFGKPAFLSVSG